MNIPTIIETVFSIITVIILLCIITSAIYELVGRYTRERSKLLKNAINKALDDPGIKKKYAELLYEHPQIRSMHRTTVEMPSYIAPAIFASALIDVVIREYETENLEHDKNSKTYKLPKNIEDTTTIEKFRQSLDSLGFSELGRFLRSIAGDAENIKSVRDDLADWYAGYMDRVSGWYKRKAQNRLLVIGFIVAVALNANIINITQEVYEKAELRTELVVLGTALQPDSNNSELSDAELKQKIKENYNKLENTGISIGWGKISDLKNASSGQKFKTYLLMLLGWIITALAISRGAPFWFGVLSSVANLRSTGIASNKKAK